MKRKPVFVLSAALLIAALAGCNMGANATTAAPQPTESTLPTDSMTSTPLPATAAPGSTQAPIPGKPTSPPANLSPTPLPVGSSGTRVTFAAGATHASTPGSVTAHGTMQFIVNVAAGQLLDVSVDAQTAPQPQVAVVGADGKAPANVLTNNVSFRGAVPTSQDYTVTVTGGDQGTQFELNVSVPERISFVPGGDETVVGSNVGANDYHQYVLNLAKGQLLELSIGVSGVHTQVYGADGNVLQSGMGEGAGFRGIVPSSQDYIVNVVSAGEAVDYAMTVKVPQRISFDVGATSVVAKGAIQTHGAFAYIINLQGGQVLDVSSDQPDTAMGMTIYGIDGNVLKTGASSGGFRGKVPTTQDYIIDLTGSGAPVAFTLNIVVAQRISFAAGATSATLSGGLKAHESHFFIVAASAGQTLTVTLTPAGSAKLTIYGLDGNVLSSGNGQSTSFSGKLPTGQDYYIVLQAGDQPVAQFQLAVTIK